MPLESKKTATHQQLVSFLTRAAEDDENANAVHRTIGAYLGTIEGKQFTLREKKKALAAIEAKYKGAKAGLRSSYSCEYIDVIGGPFPRRVSVCLPRTAYVDCAAWEDSNGCTGTAAEARAKRCRDLLKDTGRMLPTIAESIENIRREWQGLQAWLGDYPDGRHNCPIDGVAEFLTGLSEKRYGEGSADSYYAEAAGLDLKKLRPSGMVSQLSKEAEK